MPRPGPGPRDAAQRRRTNSPEEWVDVPNELYTGKRPTLPRNRTVLIGGGKRVTVPYRPETREWWRAVTTMPHCALWGPGEWQFALLTAVVADTAYLGSIGASAELRHRERAMGTTADARRALRIRYTNPAPVAHLRPVADPEPGDYRDL